jgi:peptide deformylase
MSRREEEERPEVRWGDPELAPEELAARAEALEQVRRYGDPVLRAEAKPVERFDAALRGQVAAMIDLMDRANGAGLAAPQVGTLGRFFVHRLGPEDEPAVLVNPVLEDAADATQVIEEGCLSIPGLWVPVERPAAVRMRGQDVDGEEVLLEVEGRAATVLQHELDHLDGVLMLDRLDKGDRKVAMRLLRERS